EFALEPRQPVAMTDELLALGQMAADLDDVLDGFLTKLADRGGVFGQGLIGNGGVHDGSPTRVRLRVTLKGDGISIQATARMFTATGALPLLVPIQCPQVLPMRIAPRTCPNSVVTKTGVFCGIAERFLSQT